MSIPMLRGLAAALITCAWLSPAAGAQGSNEQVSALQRLEQFEDVFERCSADLLHEITAGHWAGFGVRGQLGTDKAYAIDQFRSLCEGGSAFQFEASVSQYWTVGQVHTIAAIFSGVMIRPDGQRVPNNLRVSLVIAPDKSGTLLLQHTHVSALN